MHSHFPTSLLATSFTPQLRTQVDPDFVKPSLQTHSVKFALGLELVGQVKHENLSDWKIWLAPVHMQAVLAAFGSVPAGHTLHVVYLAEP